jgi:putative ABC transport system permease protein
MTITGVVSNISQSGQVPVPLVYLPFRARAESEMSVFARIRVSPTSLVNAFRREVHALDSDLPVGDVWTIEQWLRWKFLDDSIIAAMFLIFAAIALLLASVGLYAVIAHSVSQRTQEIGVRMAIGAVAGDILRLVVRQGMVPLGIGLGAGLAATFALTPVLQSVLVGVSPADPVAIGGAVTVLLLASLAGCLIPARRAMRIDPAAAVRHE